MNHRTFWRVALGLTCAAGLLMAQRNTPPQQAQPAAPQAQAAPQSPVAKQPVVKSKEEGDAVGAVITAIDSDARIQAGEKLLKIFPDTEFKATVLYFMALSYQEKNDYAKTVAYLENALQADPQYYQAMLLLGRNLAARTKEADVDREEKLTAAEKYANQALEILKTAPRPNPSITDVQWEEAKKFFTAQAHEALGMAAVVRKKNDEAVAEFKKAIEQSSEPDPTTMIRLGSAYSDGGKYDEAIAILDKVVGMTGLPDQIQKIAKAERERAVKSKGAAPAKP